MDKKYSLIHTTYLPIPTPLSDPPAGLIYIPKLSAGTGSKFVYSKSSSASFHGPILPYNTSREVHISAVFEVYDDALSSAIWAE